MTATDANATVGTAGKGLQAGRFLLPGFPVQVGPTTHIVTTQAHVDHVGGVGLFREPGTVYVAQANNPACQHDDARIQRLRFAEGTPYETVLGLAPEAPTEVLAPEVAAVVQTARDYGYRVAAHAHGKEGMKRAVLGGVDSIEHGTYMDDEIFALMKKHGTWYVPTISAGRYVAEKAKVPGYYPEVVRPKAERIGALIQDTFAKAYKAGVKIGFGTDAAVYPHGENAKEFAYMVEAGMPAQEAILSATAVNAGILGMSDKIGTLETGKLADIIATDENPLQNISTLETVFFVMKDGVVYKGN